MHLAIRITGPLQYELLQQALGEVVRRHETLRSRFKSYGGSERVIIDETLPMTLPTIDLRNVNGKELEDRIARHAREHASEPFDLAKGPLFKFELLVVNDCDHVLLLNVHHIVSDGWPMGLLIEELMKLYDAAVAGRPLLLAPLPIQYVD
jgi:surfactin family lipopeptide synthetase A